MNRAVNSGLVVVPRNEKKVNLVFSEQSNAVENEVLHRRLNDFALVEHVPSEKDVLDHVGSGVLADTVEHTQAILQPAVQVHRVERRIRELSVCVRVQV